MVERFYGPLVGYEMRPGERGDFVRYSDYATLRRRMEELEAREIEHGFRLEAEEAKSEHWRAEAARLREALSDMLTDYVAEHPFADDDDDPDCPLVARRARAALGRKA